MMNSNTDPVQKNSSDKVNVLLAQPGSHEDSTTDSQRQNKKDKDKDNSSFANLTLEELIKEYHHK